MQMNKKRKLIKKLFSEKRGILPDFLLSLVIGIGVAVALGFVLSNLFLKDKTKANFEEFHEFLEDFHDDELVQERFTLNLDQGHALLLFTDKNPQRAYTAEKVISEQGPRYIQNDSYFLDYPQDCDDDLPCLCMCRSFGRATLTDNTQKRTEQAVVEERTFAAYCSKWLCKELDAPIKRIGPYDRMSYQGRSFYLSIQKSAEGVIING
jgi:hypothetical protein